MTPQALEHRETLKKRAVEAYAAGKTWREIAAEPDMPGVMTIWDWEESDPDFRNSLARARRIRGADAARQAGAILDTCEPDAEPHKTSSARVTLASHKSAYYRWLAAHLDKDTWGDSLKVDADVNVRAIIAFGDMTTAAKLAAEATQTASTRVLPHVCVPDGGAVEDAALADTDAAGDDT